MNDSTETVNSIQLFDEDSTTQNIVLRKAAGYPITASGIQYG